MRSAMRGHAGDDELELYSMGRLSGHDLEVFEEHLLVCASCQDRLAEVDSFVRATRTAAKDLAGDVDAKPGYVERLRGVFSVRHPAWLAAAAVAVLVAGIFWIFRPGFQATQTPAVAVYLQTSRSGDKAASVSADYRPELKIDVSEWPALSSYTVELVDARGERVWQSAANPGGGKLTVAVGRTLPKGLYWVRLYASVHSGEALREYALKVQ